MALYYPKSSHVEQQLSNFIARLSLALESDNWQELSRLDNKLKQALPMLGQHKSNPAVQEKLRQLTRLYSEALEKARLSQSETQYQLSQQTQAKEGMLAYIQHQK